MTQVRAGLATRIATISSLTNRSFAVFPDRLPGPPFAIVTVPTWTYDQAMSGGNVIEAEVLIAAAEYGKGQERAQTKLDAYLDDTDAESIKAAIEGDVSLGGVADSVRVTGWSEYGDVEINTLHYLGAVLRVEVFA